MAPPKLPRNAPILGIRKPITELCGRAFGRDVEQSGLRLPKRFSGCILEIDPPLRLEDDFDDIALFAADG